MQYVETYKDRFCSTCKAVHLHARTDAGERYRRDIWVCVNCYNKEQDKVHGIK